MTERCNQCGAEVPPEFAFCGKCGTKLGTQTPPFSKDSRERRLLENEIAEAVADRLIKWGKFLGGIFLGAFAVLGLSLAFWGVTSISTLKKNLEGLVAEVTSKAEDLKKQVDSATSEVADLRKQYKELAGDLDHYRQVNRQIERLQKDLQTINGQITNWYDLLESEVFDALSADRVHFVALSIEEKKALLAANGLNGTGDEPLFRAVMALKKAPIPASVRITRYNLSIDPKDIKVDGRQVSFTTRSDKFGIGTTKEEGGPPIYVQYHPAR
jgi:uncharacterized protein YoxC